MYNSVHPTFSMLDREVYWLSFLRCLGKGLLCLSLCLLSYGLQLLELEGA
jgi:hypothetical protein